MTFHTCQSADEPCVSTEVEAVGCKEDFSQWTVSCHMTDFLLKTKVNFPCVLSAGEKLLSVCFFVQSAADLKDFVFVWAFYRRMKTLLVILLLINGKKLNADQSALTPQVKADNLTVWCLCDDFNSLLQNTNAMMCAPWESREASVQDRSNREVRATLHLQSKASCFMLYYIWLWLYLRLITYFCI